MSRLSGQPTSTAHRLAGRLVEGGSSASTTAATSSASGGSRWRGNLAEATHQHVLLAVLEEDEALPVERLSSRTAAPVLYRVGGPMPLHSTGVGMVLLAYAEAELQGVAAGRPAGPPARGVPVDVPDLRRQLARVRRDGVAPWRRPDSHAST